jgi:glycosyltransferase involved in cell wall biosynthesis
MPAHPDHRFSIILPVHNGGAYLEEALASVFAQTYPHFELVVLENASTDETPQTLQAVADPRITVIPSETLLPIGENWARATVIRRDQP